MKAHACNCDVTFRASHVPQIVYCKRHSSVDELIKALSDIAALAAKSEAFNPMISEMIPQIRIIAQEAVKKAGVIAS